MHKISNSLKPKFMARFKLSIEYDGTNYSGWQVQKNAKTIQGEFFRICETVFETKIFEFHGAGRTDAGVHALQQVAHLDVKTKAAPDIIRTKLNSELPPDIHVLHVEPVTSDFNARYTAMARSYIYQISKRRSAFGKRYIWWIREPLNIELMREAAQVYTGFKDYRSFAAKSPEDSSTQVEILLSEIIETDDMIVVHFVGSHFLWNMVRRMVGVLVEVGKGKMVLSDVHNFFRVKSNTPARFTAPSSGLFLEHIYYPEEAVTREFRTVLNLFS